MYTEDDLPYDSEEEFSDDENQQSEPKEERRWLCENCEQVFPNLQACAKCQKEDWPQHKKLCARAAEADLFTVGRFMSRLFGEGAFILYLSIAILQKLRSKNLELSPDKAFKLKIHIGIEPVNIRDFRTLVTSPTYFAKGRCLTGMLQVLGITVSDEPPVELRTSPQYGPTRLKFDNEGDTNTPLVILEMTHSKAQVANPTYTTTRALPLLDTTFEMTDNEIITSSGYTIPAASESDEDKRVTKPATSDSSLEMLNMLIRNDHENRHHLRQKMLREDMKMVHMSVTGRFHDIPAFKDCAQAWVDKVLREEIYKVNPDTVPLQPRLRHLGKAKHK